jgi:hypothetical protein
MKVSGGILALCFAMSYGFWDLLFYLFLGLLKKLSIYILKRNSKELRIT